MNLLSNNKQTASTETEIEIVIKMITIWESLKYMLRHEIDTHNSSYLNDIYHLSTYENGDN